MNNEKMKPVHLLLTLLFGVAVVLFFGLAYPHHLHYQEQYQLFLFDCGYVWDIVRWPGGVADLLGRFCTQFFLYAWVGAVIIALLLSAVQLLVLRLAEWGRLYGLTFVPSFLLWLFLLDENALLGGVWAVLLTLVASWGLDWLPDGWLRRILLIAAVPVLYFLVGPVCLLFFLLQAPSQKSSVWYYGVLLLLVFMPVALSFYYPVPASRLWYGFHYYRYPTEMPLLLWAAAFAVFLLVLTARVFRTWANVLSCRFLVPSLPSYFLIFLIMGGLVWKSGNFKAEKVMKYDFMARYQQWNRILETIRADKPNNQIGVTVQNLALAMRGQLVDHLFDYNQNGIAGLLPDFKSDATSPLPTAEVFYQLGLTNVAQRSVFEAQEAILDFQKSARCYKRLAETNLINGSYEVARKYLLTLQKTLFYSEWASETLALLGNEDAIARHPEYGRLRQIACTEDFFFSAHATPEMLESLYFNNTSSRLAYEYLVAYCLLTGDVGRLNNLRSQQQKD